MALNDIIQVLKRYAPEEIFLWVQTTAIHPLNQSFYPILEHLLGLLFSIPLTEFRGEKVTREQFMELIEKYTTAYSSSSFIDNPDYFERKERIPYFFNGEKFYFFYGDYDRPYEFLKQFEAMYLRTPDEREEFSILRMLFQESLSFQTKLIEVLDSHKIKDRKSKRIQIPSQKFYNMIVPLFLIDEEKSKRWDGVAHIKFGSIESTDLDELIEKSMRSCLFQSIFVKIEEKTYFLLPQAQMGALYQMAKKTLDASPRKREIRESLSENYEKRLVYSCLRFFGVNSTIAKVAIKDDEDEQEVSVSCAAIGGTNNLFLFKAVRCSETLPKRIQQEVKETNELIDKIKNSKEIKCLFFNGLIGETKVSDLQIYPFIIFETPDFCTILEIPKGALSESMQIMPYLDLIALFESFEYPFDFLDFFKDDLYLYNNHEVVCIDYLDRLAIYLTHGRSYPITPENVRVIIPPHTWSNFVHQKLVKRYQDKFYESIERKFSNKFNRIKRLSERIYSVIDTATLEGGFVINLEGFLILVLFPSNFQECSYEERRMLVDLIGPLICDSIDKLRSIIKRMFENSQLDKKRLNYIIFIYPRTLVERRSINFLKQYLNLLRDEEPILCLTRGLIKENEQEMLTRVIYDHDKLPFLFSQNTNIGEQSFAGKFIRSLLFFLGIDPKNTFGKSLDGIIKENIPEAKKGYGYESLYVVSPLLDKYPKFRKPSNSDFSRVEQRISNFLNKEKVLPGVYKGENAKKITNKVLGFLYNQLVDIIKKHDESLLKLAYREVEIIEGHRKMNEIKSAIDAHKYTEYNPQVVYSEILQELTNFANPAKYIVETILKTGVKGKKVATFELLKEMLATSVMLHLLNDKSERIHRGINPPSLKIDKYGHLDFEQGEEGIDFNDFVESESALHFEFLKEKLDSLRKPTEPVNIDDLENKHWFIDELNCAFETAFGFSLIEFKEVFDILAATTLPDSSFFPLNIATKSKLISEIKRNLKIQLDDKKIVAIIDLLSLDPDSYKNRTKFLPYSLLKDSKRLNVLPLVKIKSDTYIYGNFQVSTSLERIWMGNVVRGYFPYSLEPENPIQKVLRKYHKELDDQFEDYVSGVIEETLGKENTESGIDNFKRLSSSFPRRPDCGEIDHLAINKNKKIIFVLDSKNQIRMIEPKGISKEIKRFFGSKGHYEKLCKKEEFVKGNICEILRHFSVKDHEGWETKKALVVNSYYISSFLRKRPVDFVLFDDLKNYLLE